MAPPPQVGYLERFVCPTVDSRDFAHPKPPPAVQKVMEAVCVLLGKKPDWDTAKKEVLSDMNFINNLKTYDKDNIPPKMLKKVRRYTAPEEMAVEENAGDTIDDDFDNDDFDNDGFDDDGCVHPQQRANLWPFLASEIPSQMSAGIVWSLVNLLAVGGDAKPRFLQQHADRWRSRAVKFCTKEGVLW